ncbi:MFS efflux pump atnC-like protein [Cladobotryum mycophilum]|uniref:MFS efflux pump atnC-like protein n=1 Tax=Cladobotryum mycophilum TaxID=491253 RepID=A0ABR0SR13_9HYPO
MTSTAYSMLTDVTAEAERGKVFLQIGVAVLTSQAVALPLASMMMEKYGNTVPILVGYAIGLLTCLLILALPETITKKVAVETDSEPDETASLASNGQFSHWMEIIMNKAAEAVDSFGFLLKSPALMAMVLSFLMNTLGSSSINIAIQYISKRFSISIASAGYLLTVRAIVTVVVFLFAINMLGKFLTHRYELRGPPRDLWLARLTVLFFPLGFLLISIGGHIGLVAVGMSFTAFGLGSGSLMRSVATALVHKDQVARLHAAMCLVDNVGTLVSGPLLAETYTLGLRLGDGWIALPFIAATVLTTLGSWITWLVRMPETSDSEE